ncbi:MAG TPA: exodeoxyribonuclease V subunit beta, partial [Thiolapillus brandeum]|nr:exodeoxyribonuclease V subunit beta [Thiolapillus brandeum]
AAFLHGSRWSRSPAREDIKGWLDLAKVLKAEGVGLQLRLDKARAYELVMEGINSIRQSIQQAKRAQRVMGFDDLVERLVSALDAASGEDLAKMLAQEYPAALVDEFQDTDPLQYQVLQQIYTPARRQDTALYLIGDPKQAIYAFRGGDVFAYLRARSDADQQWQMDTNWRSSAAMIQAYNRLFHGAPLDQPEAGVFGLGIEYQTVRASGKGDEALLQDQELAAAMQLVHFPLHEDYASRDCNKAGFRKVIAQWCAAEIARLLSGDVLLGDSPLQARDIVILVRDRTEADELKSALDDRGLPSVYLSLRDKLFASEQASELHQALLGILELEDERLARAGLASAYLGGDVQQLQRMNEEEDFWEQQHQLLRQLRNLWRERGFVAMALTLFHHHYHPPAKERERALTNSLHLMELLQQASQRHAQPRELLNWLGEQIRGEGENIEAELRLETDADLLRIQTQHGAKGLEYPVVFIPFASRYKDPLKVGQRNIEVFNFHHSDTLAPVSHLGWDEKVATLTKAENHAESVRLLYVAVTRAVARCYICTAPFSAYQHSSLGLVLGLSDDGELEQALEALAADAADIELMRIEGEHFAAGEELPQGVESADQLAPASFTGHIRRDWWLSSFSAMTRNLRHGGIALPDRDQMDQKRAEESGELRFVLPAGAAAGNLLHEIFEHLDFARPDWERTLQRPLARFGSLPPGFMQKDLIAWLQEVLHTPLRQGLSLDRLEWQQTLRETAFYFPMLKGSASALERILADHRGNSSPVELPVKRKLQGMMHGYIDLIFEWQGRYYVADYKSNFLGSRLPDYSPAAIENSMQQAFYDLQYLLYSLALHRYLQTRLPDYHAETHFGGVYYFYLRGMSPQSDTGVYYRSFPQSLLMQLDALFRGNSHV